MGGRVSFPVVSLPRDRAVVVTGGNTGLGYEIAKWIAMMGASVIIACRSEERATEAIQRMNEEYGKEKEKETAKGRHSVQHYDTLAVEFMPLDLSSFQSTLAFAEKFKLSGKKLHVLICNAGIAMAPFAKTDDGFERMLQINYLSHFLLIAKLLPVMRKSGEDCRLLLMSSDAHRSCRFDIKAMNYDGPPNKFGRLDYYGRSKLYQIMQMFCMTRRLQGTNISVNSSHPGIISTEINRNFKDSFFWDHVFFNMMKVLGQTSTILEGATSLINAAVNPDLIGVSGMYFKDCKDGFKTDVAMNKDNQEMLWQQTLEYLKDYITDDELKCMDGKS